MGHGDPHHNCRATNSVPNILSCVAEIRGTENVRKCHFLASLSYGNTFPVSLQIRNVSVLALSIGYCFRYHNILRTIEKGPIQEVDVVRYKIREVNAIQTVNSVLQYCPQFIFQSFLIIHRKYKCVITGEKTPKKNHLIPRIKYISVFGIFRSFSWFVRFLLPVAHVHPLLLPNKALQRRFSGS